MTDTRGSMRRHGSRDLGVSERKNSTVAGVETARVSRFSIQSALMLDVPRRFTPATILLLTLCTPLLACGGEAASETAPYAAASMASPAAVATPNDALDAFLDGTDALLSAIVTSRGHVRYSAIDVEALGTLVQQIGAIDASVLSDAERKAFYVNAYNVLVLKAVLDAGTPSSPLDDGQFFDEQAYTVAGETLSLNGLEKQRLYRDFPDARLHFALVCAANGCPPLLNKAYRPTTLGRQLDTQTRRSLGLAHLARVDGDTLMLSELFEWYRSDFERDNDTGTLVGFVRAVRDDVPRAATVEFMTYDWTLNAAR